MKEINYTYDMRMKDAPVIRKRGLFGPWGETTPFVWHGKLKWLHTVTAGDPHTYVFDSHFILRDDETGELSGPLCPGYHFYSCFVENDVLYVFCTNEHEGRRWGGDTVTMLWSDDLITFRSQDVLHRPGWQYFNTSVCRGRGGRYVLAVEAGAPKEPVGVPFTTFFAVSDDLFHWTPMPDDVRYSDRRYTACPALRYLPADDYYYMICLEALPLARYAPYIYRTRDFVTWEIGIHNPVLWISPEDRTPAPGAQLTPEQAELARTYVNINDCDVDLCEFGGKTRIGYNTGDQLSIGFFCEAEYDGPMERFLQSFFE